jgi:ABC-type branched-subunit amino acid transport system substrate-binding protein
MASYAAKELKIKTVGVIDDRTAFGQGIADEFAKQARASGVKVAGREFTNDKASDFAAILTAFRAKKVDAIFFGGYAPQGAPMARQMKQLGLANVRLLGGDTLCSPEMAKLGGDAVGENVRARRPARSRQAARTARLQGALQGALPARPGRVRARVLRPDHVHRPGHEGREHGDRPRSASSCTR